MFLPEGLPAQINMKPPLWPFVIASLLLLIAVPPIWPYGFYILLRFFICGVSVYGAIQAHERGLNRWVWTLSVMAVLFNPLIRIHLTKDVWALIDLVAAIFFAVAAFTLRLPQPKVPSLSSGIANGVVQKILEQAKPEDIERCKIDAAEFERLKDYCQDIGLKLDKITGGYVVLAPSGMDPYRDQWIKKDLQNRFHVKVGGQSMGAGPMGWRMLGKFERTV